MENRIYIYAIKLYRKKINKKTDVYLISRKRLINPIIILFKVIKKYKLSYGNLFRLIKYTI